jgi:hypothetical protein
MGGHSAFGDESKIQVYLSFEDMYILKTMRNFPPVTPWMRITPRDEKENPSYILLQTLRTE